MENLNHTLFFVQGNPRFEYCDAAVLGVAFDGNASYGKGAAEAPDAIMEASHNIETEEPLTGKTLEKSIHNFGVIRPKGAKEMIKLVGAIAEKSIEAKKFFILLGGDHSIVNGLLKAVPQGTTFLNFDAHLDLREEYHGKKESHAAGSRRIFEKGFEQVWVGARDMIGEEEMNFVSEQGLARKIFYCPSMPAAFYRKHSFPQWMHKKNMLFGEKPGKPMLRSILAAIKSDNVWLNIDIDCLDLRQGIETGVPTPFGLTLESLNEILFEVCGKKQVIGFSLAEVIPDKGNRSQTIAAMLCYNILSWS